MRHLILISLLLAPLTAFAADYSDGPLVVYGSSAEKALEASKPPAPRQGANGQWQPGFPDWAITQAAQNTGGNTNPMPGAAPNAPQAPNASHSASAATPAAPGAPAAPASPISKLWPVDTVPIFVRRCVGFHVELVPSCSCVITNLMTVMGHDEFLALTADGSIEKDQRLNSIRSKCIAAPKREQ